MAGREEKRKAQRQDTEDGVYVGPPSVPLVLREVASCSYFKTDETPPPLYRGTLSISERETLKEKCSLDVIRNEVQCMLQDDALAIALRKRMLTWIEDGSPGEAETDRAKRRKRTDSRKSQASSAENECVDVEDGESRARAALESLQCGVPACFRYMADSQLASAYYHRDGKLNENALARPTDTHQLKNAKDSTSESRSAGSSESRLILSVNMYARQGRGRSAKRRDVGSHMDDVTDDDVQSLDEHHNLDDEHERETEAAAEGSAYDASCKEKIRSDRQHGPLQLVQRLELSSDATLQDLRDSFICRKDDLPEKCRSDVSLESSVNAYSGRKRKTDSIFLIEDDLYSEYVESDQSYARSTGPPSSDEHSVKKMLATRIDSISLRLGKLYWFLHQGNCEHAWCITSVRKPRESEVMSACLSTTTYLQYGHMIRPLVRWSRTVSRVDAYSLNACDICLVRTACMVLHGGERYRPPAWSGVKMDGIDALQKTFCEPCWLALIGQPSPTIDQLIDRAGRAVSADMSDSSWARQSGPGWTVIPNLE